MTNPETSDSLKITKSLVCRRLTADCAPLLRRLFRVFGSCLARAGMPIACLRMPLTRGYRYRQDKHHSRHGTQADRWWQLEVQPGED